MADAAENSVLFVSIIAIYASLGFFIVFIWAYRQRKRLASRQRAPQRCMPLAWGDLTSFETQFVIAALQETAATKIEPQPHHASRNPGWRLVADDQGNMIEQNYQQDMARALDSLAEIAATYDASLTKRPGESWRDYLQALCQHAPPLASHSGVARAISTQFEQSRLGAAEVELHEFDKFMRSVSTLSSLLSFDQTRTATSHAHFAHRHH
ncbi:hypothetical protein CAOG_05076 [Capsaspora owczarzaki ATCC 30864]|uniref:Uncharacterized protein n=1 Tax=Capsaspora owczarzaki (strain ATCC 30864) TaxID=595528 RepID=A0A0D2WSI8_CAPO3|nr:hypothetical protein CAOG_05076 [Capsaspora owczarzaki ATCC 30864]KJE94433.1 hypothetical protein CAOG_005076 [Capsaspora owczarzaki ATCC 30864]|eukprot:XP_004346761.2 hypothetical protein CAOG_05076 [Capsaspora owczarzaki ATCC 30864]